MNFAGPGNFPGPVHFQPGVVAKLIGPQTALATLRKGEERGAAVYRAVLDSAETPRESRYLLRTRLLPECTSTRTPWPDWRRRSSGN